MNELTKCGKCGSPVLGNETFCSNCGQQVQTTPAAGSKSSAGLKAILWIFAVVGVLGIAAAAGVYIAGRRVLKNVRSKVAQTGVGSGSLRRVAQSLGTADAESRRPQDFGCSLLSREDAAAIAGTAVTRTESTSDSCGYFGVPDPSLNPEAIAIKSVPGANADPQVSGMIDRFAAGMRATAEEQDPNIRAGPGGERLLFSAGSSAALSATMELSRGLAAPQAGGETIPGLGDEAFFVTMHRMFFVRKGTSYLLIQPRFVRDPRGVAIAAAKKILESPNFGK
jgi:hypothetical protein